MFFISWSWAGARICPIFFQSNKSNFSFTLLYLFKTHEKQGRTSSFSEPFFTFLILLAYNFPPALRQTHLES